MSVFLESPTRTTPMSKESVVDVVKCSNTRKRSFIHSPDRFMSSPNKRLYLHNMSPNVLSKTIYIPPTESGAMSSSALTSSTTSITAPAVSRPTLERPPLLKPPSTYRSKSSITYSRLSSSPKHKLRRTNSLISQGGSFSSSDNQQQLATTSSDRFIPSSHNSASNKLHSTTANPLPNASPQTHIQVQTSKLYQHHVAEACGLQVNSRVLLYQPFPPERSKPVNLFSNYSSKKSQKSLAPAIASARANKIPTAPERVLDAPGLGDNFYLNLLAWSSTNLLAIGLEDAVYVWNASTGSVGLLCELPNKTLVTSLRWSDDGSYISIGKEDGLVEIWDIETNTKLRTLNCENHQTRIASQAWNQHILTSGSRLGNLYHSDVRVAQHIVSKQINVHTAEICGIEYKPDGQQLATGGNDNLVSIWDVRQLQSNTNAQPLFMKNNHKAAIKALSWCPQQSNLLATGGGSSDKTIHFWNTSTGARVNTIETDSQISSLNWGYANGTGLEIVATHGFPSNNISLFNYPTLQKTGEIIRAHDSRLLNGCLSPDNLTLATIAGDENLKFWSLFDLYKPKGRNSNDRHSNDPNDEFDLISNDKTKPLKKMMNLR